jgi:hypothetical protein
MHTRSASQPYPASCALGKQCFGLGAALLLGVVSKTAAAASPENFTKLKFTEVVENVTVLEARSQKAKPATVNSVLTVPDRVATGPNSRAELLAPDGTVTRVGASTVFSFSAERREINLQKGSVLFHSPTGKGGGLIRTNGAQAAVMGTTLIVTATAGGGFKLLVLEGKAKATLTNGASVNVTAGQLTLVEPGRPDFGPVLTFRLREQVAGSALLKGFQTPVASEKKVLSSVDRQERMIEKGRAEPTRFRVRGDKLVEGGEQPPPQKERAVHGDIAPQRKNRVPKGTLDAAADLIGAALKQDVLVQELGREPASSLFTFTKAPTEMALSLVVGQTALDTLSSRYANKTFQLLLAKNLTVAGTTPFPGGSLSDYLFPSSPWQVKILAANGALLVTEGRALQSILTAIKPDTLDAPVLPPTESLLWIAAKDSIAVTRSSLQATSNLFMLGTPALAVPVEISLTESNLINRYGDITLQASKITSFDTSILARGDISIESRTDVSIENTKIREMTAGLPASSLKITALKDLTINSQALAALTGPGNATKLNAQTISLEARTLVLKDIDFKAGSTVSLSSSDGTLAANPNTNRPVQNLKVNFISGVKYGGVPISPTATTTTLPPSITLKANGLR